MSREILFRAQHIKTGEKVNLKGEPAPGMWVYGGILQGTGDHSIVYSTEPEIKKWPVYTDTVGQFTGLTDKNGKKIFEGDIVKYQFDNDDCPFPNKHTEKIIGRIFFSDFRASFSVTTGKNGSDMLNNDLFQYVQNGNRVEVIGNIHDNPELLRVTP